MSAITWPKHDISMSIEHNQHKVYYETIEQALESGTYRAEYFEPEDLPECIQTDEVWSIQWYPDTPVGFHMVCASTFERALALATKP